MTLPPFLPNAIVVERGGDPPSKQPRKRKAGSQGKVAKPAPVNLSVPVAQLMKAAAEMVQDAEASHDPVIRARAQTLDKAFKDLRAALRKDLPKGKEPKVVRQNPLDPTAGALPPHRIPGRPKSMTAQQRTTAIERNLLDRYGSIAAIGGLVEVAEDRAEFFYALADRMKPTTPAEQLDYDGTLRKAEGWVNVAKHAQNAFLIALNAGLD